MPPRTRTIIGIDLGSATVATAVAEAGDQARALPIKVGSSTAHHYRSSVVVDDTGEVKRPDHQGTVAQRIGNLTKLLGQPPQIIAGTPWGANALIEMVLRPALTAAEESLGHRPDHIAAVVPAHWPDYIVTDYRNALATTGLAVSTILASEALCAVAETQTTLGAVTCLDFGAKTASLTMAIPESKGRSCEIHRADPRGGQVFTDTRLVSQIASRLDPTFIPDQKWVEKATAVGRAIRLATRKTQHPTDLIEANLPAPFGKVNVPSGQVTDLVEDLVRGTLLRLTRHDDVDHIWGIDEDEGHPLTLLVAGGFSTEKAVGTAIRTSIGPWRAHDTPEALPAIGAAQLVADGGEK